MLARTLSSLSKKFRPFSRSLYFFGGDHHHHHAEPVLPFNDSGDVVTDALSATVKGVLNMNSIEEHDKTLIDAQKKTMKRFLIYRSNPSVPLFPSKSGSKR